jgi:hypothetical protein
MSATLRDAFEGVMDEDDFGSRLRSFLDDFARAPSPTSLADEPRVLCDRLADGGRADAYLAALAEHLSRKRRFPVPSWALSPSRVLERPWFAFRTTRGKLFLLTESPAAFRARNLFIGREGLDRI